MRSTFYGLLLTLLTCTSLFALPGVAQGAEIDFAPRLAFGADPTTQMTIVWNAPRDASGHRLEYGLTPDLGQDVKPTQRDLGALKVWPVYARLQGLQPDAEYYYRISLGDQQDEIRRFRTAPTESAGFNFLAWGDQSSPGAPESSGDAPRRVLELANRTEADFALILGDLSYAGTNEDWWNRYVEMVAPLGSRKPLMTVAGNHDLYGGSLAYRTRFRMPTEGDVRWYEFRYGNAQFIGLDTESFCNDARDGSGAAPFKETECPEGLNEVQRAFLQNALKEAREDESVDWIIVYHHYPVLSSGRHGGNALVREHWGALYEEYGVNLVLTAHDHLYVRSKPIREGGASTTYVVVGTGGAQLYRHGDSPDWEAAYRDDTHGILKVHVGAAQLEAQFLSLDGDVLDSFTVDKAAGSDPGPSMDKPVSVAASAWFAACLVLGVLALARRQR